MVLKINGRSMNYRTTDNRYVAFSEGKFDSLSPGLYRLLELGDLLVDGTGKGIDVRPGMRSSIRIRPFRGSSLNLDINMNLLRNVQHPTDNSAGFFIAEDEYILSNGEDDSYLPPVISKELENKGRPSKDVARYVGKRGRPRNGVDKNLGESVSEHESAYVKLFTSLSDVTRFKIARYLSKEGEIHVRGLIDRLGMSQPAVSHHLGLMKRDGIVDIRKDGKKNYYSLSDSITSTLGSFLNEEDEDGPGGIARMLGFQKLSRG